MHALHASTTAGVGGRWRIREAAGAYGGADLRRPGPGRTGGRRLEMVRRKPWRAPHRPAARGARWGRSRLHSDSQSALAAHAGCQHQRLVSRFSFSGKVRNSSDPLCIPRTRHSTASAGQSGKQPPRQRTQSPRQAGSHLARDCACVCGGAAQAPGGPGGSERTAGYGENEPSALRAVKPLS